MDKSPKTRPTIQFLLVHRLFKESSFELSDKKVMKSMEKIELKDLNEGKQTLKIKIRKKRHIGDGKRVDIFLFGKKNKKTKRVKSK